MNQKYIRKERSYVMSHLLPRSGAVLAMLLFFFLGASQLFASHFRYGNVTWTRISETGSTVTIRLNVSLAWRLTAAPTSASFAITGGTTTGSVNVTLSNVTDPSNGWTNSTGTATTTLTKSTNLYKLAFNSGNKISPLANNDGGYWNVFTIVNTNAGGSSPVSTMPAIINMPVGAAAASYTIPASDPDPGSTLRYRLATGVEMGGAFTAGTQPTGMTIDSMTGKITFNTVGKTIGQLWNADIIVTDNNGNQIQLDFLINMTATSNPPVFDYAVTPANGTVYNVMAGQNLTFNLKATDPDVGSTVSLSASGLPTYITTSNFSPAFPATGNPSQTTFSWTPAVAQIGNTVILNFIAQDNVGVQSSTSVTIRVVAEPAPTFISPTPAQSSIRQVETGTAFSDVIRAQSSLGSDVSIAFATVPSGASFSPSVPTSGANPGQTTMTWTPTPADFGTKAFSYQATIAAVPTIFATRSYQVIANTTPDFSSTPVTTVVSGQAYTYLITVSDPNIPYGDTVDIVGTTIPSWLTLVSTGNGTAKLVGTPSASDMGTHAVQLEAEDIYHHGNAEEVVQSFNILVTVSATITPDGATSFCTGGSVVLNANTGTGNTYQWTLDGNNISGATAASYTATVAGSYKVIVTNGSSSATSSAVTVTINSNPTASITAGGPVTFCAGGNVTLTASNGSSYLWSNNATSSSVTVSSNGSYSVKVTDANGCSGTSAATTITVNTPPQPTISSSGATAFCSGGSVTLTASGTTLGNAIDLDGGDDHITIVPTSNVNNLGVSGFTLEAWIKPTSVTGEAKSIIRKTGDYNMFVYNGRISVEVWPVGGVNNNWKQMIANSAAVPVNVWSHVAVTWDNSVLRLFVNGAEVAGSLVNGSINDVNENLMIGRSQVYGNPFAGQIDEVRIWNAARTGTQINNTRFSFINPATAGLVAYYKFDEGTGTTASDATGLGSVGTLTNGPVWVVPSTVPIAYSNYLWSPNGETTPTITANASGNYSVTVTNAQNCSATSAATVVTANALPTFTSTFTQQSCVGASDGSITITGTSGASPYTYSNNGGSSYSTSGTFSGLAPGSYSLRVKDNNSCVSASAVQNIGVNLVVNGDFEAGNTGFTSGYGLRTSGIINEGQYEVAVNPAHPCFSGPDHTPTGSGKAFYANGSATPNTTVWQQTVTGIQPNTTYYFSSWVNIQCGYPPAVLQFSINGTTIGSTFSPSGSNFVWQQFFTSWNSGSNTSATIRIVNQSTISGGNDMGIDDIFFTTVAPLQISSASATKATCANAADGSVTVSATGGTAPFQFSLNNGASYVSGTSPYTFTSVAPGTYTIKIKDNCGIESNTQAVTVSYLDVTAPVAIAQNLTIQLNAAGAATITAAQVNNGSTDACGIASLSLSKTSFDCSNIGANTVTLTVTDVNGLSSTATATVTVSSSLSIATCPQTQYQQIYTGSGACNAVFNYDLGITGSPAPSVTYTFSGATTGSGNGTGSGSAFNTGQTTVTVNASNACRSTSCSFVVTVIDTTKPVVITKNITAYLSAAGTVTITPQDINNGSSDNCGTVNLSMSQTGIICGTAAENQSIVLNAPAGTQITRIDYASYGTPNGTCGNFTNGSCHSGISKSVVETYALGKTSVSIGATNGNFGDPCNGTVKRLYVQATWTGTGSSNTFNCSKVGANTVTLIVTDANGNVSTGTAVVTVLDTIKPVAAAKNVTVQLNAAGQGSTTAAAVNNGSSDACGISLALSKTSFNCSNVGQNPVTLTVTDNNGNVSTANATVTVADNVLPTALTKNITVQLNAAGTASITAAQVDNGSNDACGVTLSVSPSSFTCANVGANTVTLTVTDANNNVSTKTATVTVQDHVAPTALAKDITVQLNAAGTASITASQVDNGSNDACGVTLSVSPSSFTCANVGENTVTLTVTDANNNVSTATATVTVEDNVAPTALAKDITVQLNAAGTVSITASQVDNGSNDACGVTLSVSPSSFTCANVGENTVTLTVTDANNNVSTATATVTVEDNVAPTALAKDITVQLNAAGTASITASQVDNGSNDACGVTLSVSPSSFTCANVGENTVTLTVTDANNNVSTATATVTVEDNVAPTALAKDITVQLNASGTASITAAQVDNGSNDACGVTLSVSPSSFTCANVGTNTVTLTVTDANNNVSTKTATVTVEDNVAPTALTKNITVQLNAAGTASITASQVDNGSNDACGVTLSVSPSSFTCANVGANTVTLTVTDANNNVSTKTATVTVEDNVAPTALTKNITVQLNAAGSASITAAQVDNGSNDACGVTLSVSPSSFTCANVGANTVTLTVTDANNNVSTKTATVTVQDNVAPTALAKNITVNLNASGSASITALQVDNGSNDACGVTLSVSPSSFTCSNVGANTVTLTVTDANNNVSTTTSTVTVKDVTAPVAICRNVTIVLAGGSASVTAAQVDNGSNDACGIKTLALSKTSFNCSNIGSNAVTLTVTDNNNNVSTCQATVTVTGVIPGCSIASAPNNSGTVIGGTTTLAETNQMYLGYGAQSMNLTCTATGAAPFTYSWTGTGLSSTTIANPVFTPTIGGNYTFVCTVTNSYGCVTTCSITICVLDVRASGSGNSAKVYLCHLPPGNPGNAQTLNISINAVPAHLGNHTGDKLGTCNLSCGFSKKETAIGEIFTEETATGDVDLIVYPNPSNTIFNFRLESQSDELVSFKLYDMSGRVITAMENLSPKELITIGNNLDVGMFMAEITQGEFRKVVKITKVN